MKRCQWVGLFCFVLIHSVSLASPIDEQACLLKQLEQADDTMTIGELKAVCQSAVTAETTELEPAAMPSSAISRRMQYERHNSNPFTLLPHRPNYLILSNNFSSPNERPFRQAFPNRDTHFQPWETKFQISFKVPVVRDLFDRADLFMAYTNRSFFQQFNKEDSAPFRDSNHEPEIWLSFDNDAELFGFKNPVIRTGFSHQSNGKSGDLSRSWNRLYAEFLLERDDWYFSVKPWWRIPEDDDSDDNPDIDEFLGHFELSGLYQYNRKHNFSFMLRNNLDFGDNHGAIELGWSFPLSNNVRGYVQWFNGYGESLIDYDAHSNSLGFGIQLTDWL